MVQIISFCIKKRYALSLWWCILLFVPFFSAATTYICTLVYCDLPEQRSYYPWVGAHSSSSSFHEIYWRCAAVMFATSKKFNAGVQHVLFTNKHEDEIPAVFMQLFKALDVKIVSLEMTYEPPAGYLSYRGIPSVYHAVLYNFDVFQYLNRMSEDNDTFVVLDSDCIWLDNADELVSAVCQKGIVNYPIDYSEDHVINGLTRNDCKNIYEEVLCNPCSSAPIHYGGELYGMTGQALKKIASELDLIWLAMMDRFTQGKKVFTAEEHFLSFIFNKLEYSPTLGERFIKRVAINEQCKKVYPVLHLPAQKKSGFVKFFDAIQTTALLYLERWDYIEVCKDIFDF